MTAAEHSGGLAHMRCFNHASREAAAQCLVCERFFCRECVTEHEGRVICAPCLKGQTEEISEGRRSALWMFGLAARVVGVLGAWLFFYCVGKILLRLPTSFHEGTMWTK